MSPKDNTAIADGNSLPDGWEWLTLGDMSEKPQYGWTTKANHETGKLKLLRTTDITSGSVDWPSVPFCSEEPEDVEKYLVESGDVLISRAGSVGVSFLINKPERAVFASYLIRFRPKSSIDTKYFYYYLKSPGYWEAIGASKSGIAIPNVNASKLAQVLIPVAPLDQQKRIVAEIEKQFSRLDEAVADLKRVKANLKRYKAAVLKTAVEGRLVETEASIARREGRSYESGEQLLQRILETRRSQWKGKGKYKEPETPNTNVLPKLPMGWIWASFDQVTERVTKGSSPNWQGFEYCDKGIPFVRSQNVEWGNTDLSEIAYLPLKFNAVEKKSVLREGDVLLNIVGASIGRAAIAPTTVAGGNVNQAVAIIRLHAAGANNKFVLLYLLSEQAQRRIHEEKVDVARANFSLKDIREMPLALPPSKEQERVVAEVGRRLSVVEELEAAVATNLQRVTRLRQSILQQAFTE